MQSSLIIRWCAVSLMLFSLGSVLGQTPESQDEDAAPAAKESVEASILQGGRQAAPYGSLDNPRATMGTFLSAMVRRDLHTAVSVFDFSEMSPTPDGIRQVEYAQMLKSCIDRLSLVDAEQLSADPNGPDQPFPPDHQDAVIRVTRSADGLWRVSADTLEKLPALYNVLKDQPRITEELTSADTKPEKGVGAEKEKRQELPEDVAPVEVTKVEVPSHLKSPRRVMQTLFEALPEKDYERAVSTLDVSLLEEETPDLSPYAQILVARRLLHVIERLQVFDYGDISDDPNSSTFGFPIGQETQPITIDRGTTGAWKFSAETVANVDSLYELYKDREVKRRPWYRRQVIMGNELWRILYLFGAIFIGLLVGRVVRMVAHARSKVLQGRGCVVRSLVMESVGRTAPLVALLLGLAGGLSNLTLGFAVEVFTGTVLHVILSLIIGYFAFRMVDVLVGFLREVARRSGSTLNDMLVPIVSASLRVTVIVLVFLEIALAVSDKPPSAVIAGLGAGGLAIGLAAQDTVKNFFGSVLIFVDRPFELGDRIAVDGHDGPVETVGFRSTRIRTLDGHLVTVPNGELASKTIQNIGKRPYIRRVMNIRLAYHSTPEKIEEALAIVRELLAGHDGSRENLPPRVFLHEFLDSAVNLRAIYWFHPPNYWEYCDFGEKLNLQVIKRFREAGIEFALPAQQLFVEDEHNTLQRPDGPLPE